MGVRCGKSLQKHAFTQLHRCQQLKQVFAMAFFVMFMWFLVTSKQTVVGPYAPTLNRLRIGFGGGAILMALGGSISLSDRRLRVAAGAVKSDEKSNAKPIPAE